ncbi:Spy/CpxP family protein refolding chaperone [Dyella caseinilytica]|uniref:Spy/CpxP family protein refolding chaperone n=1 Tax=Dyella caseinilytica TaxID=1849581 RepID=A0ABX7GZC5_9GAMM|nr:Spy/CpxP family protein refolding chaperone [Dyella caseinilytica]QRN55649.1 Spy/CpxP family protein refolding chaperone [Dyella caseinilytica]GGA03412.1 hypothetical protein GCM10011408_26150 [Dyella caseinilytica]
MYKNLSFRLLLASAMAMATTFAVAAPHDGDGRDNGGSHHSDSVRGLGLSLTQLNATDAQRARITQILSADSAQMDAQRQAVQKQRTALDAMTPTDTGYQAAAARLAQAEASETQMRVIQHAQNETQIYAVLTPAQQAQLATVKAQRQAREAAWQQLKAKYPVASDVQDGR